MAKKLSSPQFKLALTLGDTTYTSMGDTPFEALSNLKKPGKIMLKGVMVISHGTQKKTLMMMPGRLTRLFYGSPKFQEINAKQLAMGLK